MAKEISPMPDFGTSSTTMFVEVLVVGIGGTCILPLLAVCVLGTKPVLKILGMQFALLAAIGLSFAYFFGIVIDRICDAFLRPWSRRLRKLHFPDNDVYVSSLAKLAQLPWEFANYSYARSRIRVCRGWLFNAPIITLLADIAIATRSHAPQRFWFCLTLTVFGIFVTGGAAFAWRSIVSNTFKQLWLQVTDKHLIEGGTSVTDEPKH